MNDPKTKIVATIGPASSSVSVLRELMRAGMDVARLNFSHGSYDFYAEVIATIRELNAELGISTAILADLQGPKLRVGVMQNGSIDVPDGSELIITTEEMVGVPGKVSTVYKQFPQDVKPGEMVLLDDGKLRMQVLSTDGKTEVKLKVLSGGKLTDKKGVNLPNTKVSLPCLTDKDKEDLDFALSQDVDWVGLSFVRSARDIIELKHMIRAQDKHARVVAKIEKPEALLEIDDIIRESDALMVARGDLGVEVPMEKVPLIQKDIIKRCLKQHRPCIVATQMMESMITASTPTRAEVNDVANAVLDHADAVMLSAETSVGKNPVEVVRVMNRILAEMGRLHRSSRHDGHHAREGDRDHDAQRLHRLQDRQHAAAREHLCVHEQPEDPLHAQPGLGRTCALLRQNGEHGPHHRRHQAPAAQAQPSAERRPGDQPGQHAHRREGDEQYAEVEPGVVPRTDRLVPSLEEVWARSWCSSARPWY